MTYFRDVKDVRAKPDFAADAFTVGICIGIMFGVILGVLLK